MKAPEDKYVRLFWRFADEYPDVYNDDGALALYTRLLRLADMAWPAAATLPFGVRKVAMGFLTREREGGALIQKVTDGTYRVRGMDKHRAKRSQSGKDAADARWGNADGNAIGNAERNADGNADPSQGGMPIKAEQSRADQSSSEQADADAAASLYQRTGRFPSSKVVAWLNDIARDHGEARLVAAIDGTPFTGPNVGDYLEAIRNALRAEDHAAERAEATAEKQRNAAKRAPVAENPIQAEMRRILQEREDAERPSWTERPA
jgi:hypothetical protein